jgi:hypothetical protein
VAKEEENEGRGRGGDLKGQMARRWDGLGEGREYALGGSIEWEGKGELAFGWMDCFSHFFPCLIPLSWMGETSFIIPPSIPFVKVKYCAQNENNNLHSLYF